MKTLITEIAFLLFFISINSHTKAQCSLSIVEIPGGITAQVTSDDSTAYIYYQWSNGSTNPELMNLTNDSTYCVNVLVESNLFDSCIATACYTYNDSVLFTNCSVSIETSGIGNNHLIAQVPSGEYSFLWNTGDTTQALDVTLPGVYCVTIEDSACSSSACIVYDNNADTNCSVAFITYYDQAYPDNIFLIPVIQGDSLSFEWDFGDGTTSTDTFPTHFYNNDGEYLVCFTANSMDNTCNATFCDTISPLLNAFTRTNTGFTISVIKNIESVGISNDNFDIKPYVYPNPAKDILYAKLNNIKPLSGYFEIIDIYGREVFSEPLFQRQGEQVLSVPIHSLSTGMYVLSIFNGTENLVFSFIKQ